MKKNISIIFSILLLIVLISVEGVCAEEIMYDWKLGHNNAPGSVRDIAAQKFKEVVEKETNNKVKIDVYASEVLGTEQEMVENLHIGGLDCQLVGCSSLVNFVPEFAAASMPFAFESYEEAYALLDGEVGNLFKEAAAKNGFKIFSFTDIGFAQITNNVRPINEPKDLEGILMRSPQEPQLVASFKQLGATVSTLPYSELYLALDQGVVDGQFNPLSNIFESGFHEVQDYISIVNIFYYFAFVAMNKDLYDSLDEDLQRVLQKAADAAKLASHEAIKVKEENYFKELEKSFKKVTYPQLEPFREKIFPVYKTYGKIAGEQFVDDILKYIREYREKTN